MKKSSTNNQDSILMKIPRAWGIQILLLFILVVPQAILGFLSEDVSASPVALILVFMSGYAGWLVWTKNGLYEMFSLDSLFYVEALKQDCGSVQRSLWHLSMGLMVLMVFMSVQALF